MANHPGGHLPSSFAEFLGSDTRVCQRCGDVVRTKHIDDGVCVGCRHQRPGR